MDPRFRASDVPWIVDWKSWRRSRFRKIRVAPETIWVIAPANYGKIGKTMGKPWENGDLYGKIYHFFMGKFTISMVILRNWL
jgi:hypothetical protein